MERIINEIDSLLAAGRSFMQISDSKIVFTPTVAQSGLSVPVSLQKEKWIEDSLSYLLDNFPKAILKEDFPEILAITESSKKGIIAKEANKQIDTIGSTLFVFRQFAQWLSCFDISQLNEEQRAIFSYVPLKEMLSYVQDTVYEQLLNKEDGRTANTAILHLYGRLFALIPSFVHLNRPPDCYILTASLRTLLEVYIDMLLLKNNLIENGIEKFFSHHNFYKFRTAQNLKRIAEEMGETDNSIVNSLKNSNAKRKKIQELWGCSKCPDHWSDLRALEERARRTDSLALYRQIYYYGNMFIHSGYIDFLRKEENAHLLCAQAYESSSGIFKQATKFVCEYTRISGYKHIQKEMSHIYYMGGHFAIWKSLQKG